MSNKELANAMENTLTESEWVIDGVPAEVDSVTVDNDDVWVNTNAGHFTRSEWHKAMCNGTVTRV